MGASIRVELPGRLPLPMRIAVRIGGEPAEPGAPVAVASGPTVVELGIVGSAAGHHFSGTAHLPIDVGPDAQVRVQLPAPVFTG